MAVIRINEIIDRLLAYHPQADTGLVQKAYVWSARLHSGSLRKSGLPYLSHPLEVAGILTELKLHESSIAAGLLHDVIEDTIVTLDELEKEFGNEVSHLVDGVTKIGKITDESSRVEYMAENYRKIILAMAQDVRVILIKLADRLHNMQTLEYLDEDKQRRIADETMEIYAPIAGRLGIHWIKAQLEDLSFERLKPDIYFRLATQTAKVREEQQPRMERIQEEIGGMLEDADIKASVRGRFKHLHSIYEKMQAQNLSFDEVHDLVAFRILVDTIPQCYDALRIIHSSWTPVPGRIKDYIALPKPNMYRSLHTTVISPAGERVEIQIRTHEMHSLAEYGIAAHWRYKETGSKPPVESSEKKTLEFVHHLVDLHEQLKDPYHFLQSIKSEVIPDEIVVFTPGGDYVELPLGATPIDLAYAIHSDIGDRCAGAKVNGRIVPLTRELKSGDTVEIITSRSVEPSKAWLDVVKSPRARAKISHYLSQKETRQVRELGRQMLETELMKYNRQLGKLMDEGKIEEVAKHYSFPDTRKLLEAVGFDKFPVRKVLTQLVEAEELRPKRSRSTASKKKTAKMSGKKTTKKKGAKKKAAKKSAGKKAAGKASKKAGTITGDGPVVSVASFNDSSLSFRECCFPLVGEDIVAVKSDDNAVVIHNSECERALEYHAERIFPARWTDKVEGDSQATLEVITEDKKGILASISSVISSENLSILRAVVHTTEEKKAIHNFSVALARLSSLQRLIKSLEGIEGVISVRRL